MKAFRAPGDTIGAIDAATAAALVATATDVALVLDRDGIIQDMAVQPADLSLELEGYGRWLGRPWGDTVAADSRPKVNTLLAEASRNVASSWRQLTHRTVADRDVPILYAAVKLGDGDRILALGRDLRAVAALQQRLVDAQMSMERDYAKLRFAETRYRLLFQTSAEAVLIIDGNSHRVLEANPAAVTLLDAGMKRTIGRPLVDLFEPASRTRVQSFLADLRSISRADDTEAILSGGKPVKVGATLFRQEAATLLLVRLATVATHAAADRLDGEEATLADFAAAAPDGFVMTDGGGRIVASNAAFAGMVQLAEPAQVRGATLDQWFGRPGVDFNVVMANLREHGSVKLFATSLRGEQGGSLDVETSAVAVGEGKSACYGFSIRDVGRRLNAAPRTAPELPRSAEQLTELIGRVPLKDLVRETTDVIEKLCIEAALELTGDNRASAAEVLGLSRQSLYVKLRRFGFAEIEDNG